MEHLSSFRALAIHSLATEIGAARDPKRTGGWQLGKREAGRQQVAKLFPHLAGPEFLTWPISQNLTGPPRARGPAVPAHEPLSWAVPKRIDPMGEVPRGPHGNHVGPTNLKLSNGLNLVHLGAP